MDQQPPPDQPRASLPPDDPLDAVLAAAFGQDPGPSIPAGAGVLKALRPSLPEVPRVHLREPQEKTVTPVVRAGSPETPAPIELADTAGRYQLVGEIARGGMGAIWKGRDVDLGRDIAVKVLLETHRGRTELAQRFMEEAQIAGQLQHPGIVPVYDLGLFPDRRPYFIMKLVSGQTLAALLHARKDLAEEGPKLLSIFEQVCQTLAYSHARGVIHRDLKPSNVMVGAFGEVQVMDWGLAKLLKGGGSADEAKVRQQPETRREGDRDTGWPGPHTQAGSVLGTPAYMAPEQAQGKGDSVDERADVFGLGAILCEILTGQPPFTGSGAEVKRKAQAAQLDEAYAQLDGCGAGAELVALAKNCLAAQPWDRPRHAGAVAEAVTEYQRSVAQRLRQAEVDRAAAEARAKAERKRRQATLALAAAVLALVLVVGGGLAWWWQQRTAVVREAEGALAEARAHQRASRWPEARAALERAAGRLGSSGPAELLERLRQARADADQARADADMVAELDEIRLRLSEGIKNYETVSSVADHCYTEAFRKYGITLTMLEPEAAAARVRASAIRETLLAFLHDWLYWVPATNRSQLRAVVDRADDSQWRHWFREALAIKDAGKLKALATHPAAQTQSPVVLSCLGDALNRAGLGEEGVALLRQAQQLHPEDFWINYLLGHLLLQPRPKEALGYCRAAVALRPGSGQAHTMLGRALLATGERDAAIAASREAVALDPIRAGGKDLAQALAQTGRLEEARLVWEKVLEQNPPDHYAWYGYAELCLFLGKEDAYRRARKALLSRFGDTTEPVDAERTALACLLLPAAGDELQRAVVLADRAAAAGPQHSAYAYFQLVKGLAEYRQGRPEQALPLLQESSSKLSQPRPRLVLAMAQCRCGSAKDARRTLAAAVQDYDWREAQADEVQAWICHALRREAEVTVLQYLAPFLEGEYQPTENEERLELIEPCRFRHRNVAVARLCADSFAADPTLAADLKAQQRYHAACAAALAGSGQGEDARRLDETERARWRHKALQWLRADLAALTRQLESGRPDDRIEVLHLLQHWQQQPDLSGLRAVGTLATLPAEEGEVCRKLWADVETLLSKARATH